MKTLLQIQSPVLALAACAVSLAATAADAPPWPAGDERGMANQIGSVTFNRCAPFLSPKDAKAYELSYVRSGTMPSSPFAGPNALKPKGTGGIPGTVHAFNVEAYV